MWQEAAALGLERCMRPGRSAARSAVAHLTTRCDANLARSDALQTRDREGDSLLCRGPGPAVHRADVGGGTRNGALHCIRDTTRTQHLRAVAAPCQGVAILLDCVEASRGGGGMDGPFLRPDQMRARQIVRSREQARRYRDCLRNLFHRRDFDLLVKFYVEEQTDIGHFVNEKVQTIPGIQDTRTIITFKAF